jgi:hypothetical protein
MDECKPLLPGRFLTDAHLDPNRPPDSVSGFGVGRYSYTPRARGSGAGTRIAEGTTWGTTKVGRCRLTR